jgi:hypothetical protein
MFYDEVKLARAGRRYPPDRFGARARDRFFDLIGGRPSEELAAAARATTPEQPAG